MEPKATCRPEGDATSVTSAGRNVGRDQGKRLEMQHFIWALIWMVSGNRKPAIDQRNSDN